MSRQDLFDYVMNTPHNTNPTILKQKIKDISGASSWNDLKDKPFYVEENRTLVVEGVSNRGNYNVQTQIEVGKEYTYFIDGVEYTGTGWYDSPDYRIDFYNAMGEEICVVYEYGISMRKDPDAFHKIERVEKVYHTHHDFMIIYKVNDDTGEDEEVKVVVGDFATAKAKILKGLQATAYVCETYYGDGWQEIGNYIYELCYGQKDGDEYLALSNLNLTIRPDNTID